MTTKQILRAGVGYMPEDRSVDGLVKEFTVAENLVLDTLRPAAVRQRASRSTRPRSPRSARERIEQFDIRTSSPDAAGRARCPAATSRRSSWPGRCPGR